ncbi:hypothetical protein ACKGJO_12735 [Gracilimonas sp. Q87]
MNPFTKEIGLKWNAVTEAGSVVVGDEVKLHMNVQVVESEPVEA